MKKKKVNEKENTKEKLNSDKKMVNMPLTLKKFNSFNESETPTHKENIAKILISNDANLNQDSKNNGEIVYFNKPILRTGSTINAVKII